MLRINQFTQSPMQSPMIHADLRIIKPLENKDSLMQKTPVITGRTQGLDDSPMSGGAMLQQPNKLV